METVIRHLFRWMPLIFAIGFIAPLIAQGMAALGWAPPFGISRIVFGLVIAAPWGLYAMVKGRWV